MKNSYRVFSFLGFLALSSCATTPTQNQTTQAHANCSAPRVDVLATAPPASSTRMPAGDNAGCPTTNNQ